MLSRKLTALILSDVHLGHRTTNTQDIVDRLKLSLSKHFDQLDFIFITGDFFDSVLTLPNPVVPVIQDFIVWLLLKVKKHHIRLRVLEGTPSHDWRQPQQFIQLNQTIQADVKYYDNLIIDYESEFDIYCLYVPDEQADTTLETQLQVATLLEQHSLDKVGLSLMHGMFAFQLPKHLQADLPVHDATYYESITKYLVLIGHDHKHKRDNRIIVPGSFDRLTHGEEDPKGYLIVTLHPSGKHQTTFHVNELATTYLSLDLTKLDLKDSLTLVHDTVAELRPNSHLRLIYANDHPIANYTKELADTYNAINWSKPKVISNAYTPTAINELKTDYTTVVLNQTNLVSRLIEQAVIDQPALDTIYATTLLEEIVKDV